MSFGAHSTQRQPQQALEFALFNLSCITRKRGTRFVCGAFPVNSSIDHSTSPTRLRAMQASKDRSAIETLQSSGVESAHDKRFD